MQSNETDRVAIYWLAVNSSAFSLTKGEALLFLAGSAAQACMQMNGTPFAGAPRSLTR